MQEFQIDPAEQRLGARDYLRQLGIGAGFTLGMGLLWVLEVVRNAFFSALDRLGVPARPRSRASAYPPGRARKH